MKRVDVPEEVVQAGLERLEMLREIGEPNDRAIVSYIADAITPLIASEDKQRADNAEMMVYCSEDAHFSIVYDKNVEIANLNNKINKLIVAMNSVRFAAGVGERRPKNAVTTCMNVQAFITKTLLELGDDQAL